MSAIDQATEALFAAQTKNIELQNIITEKQLKEHDASQDVHRIYTFTATVSAPSVVSCISVLGQWFREDPSRPATVVFNSPGGDVVEGLALFDFIKSLQARGMIVNTHAIGEVASMAAVLLQAGNQRTIGPNCYMLLHEVTAADIGTLTQLTDKVRFFKELQNRLLDILAERSTLSKRSITRGWKNKDWAFFGDEAVAKGFADAVA